jgi:hypothetical protein
MITRSKTTATLKCPKCGEPMNLVRSIPKLGALPELCVFHCEACHEVEIREDERVDVPILEVA